MVKIMPVLTAVEISLRFAIFSIETPRFYAPMQMLITAMSSPMYTTVRVMKVDAYKYALKLLSSKAFSAQNACRLAARLRPDTLGELKRSL